MAATFLWGCQSEPDENAGPVRRAYAFHGKVEPRFVGEWHGNPAPSALSLRKDGSLGIVAVVMSPHGRKSSRLDGSWLVSGTDLFLRYRDAGDKHEVVLKYSATLAGDTLKLVQAGNGVKATYHRKVNR